MLIERKGMTHLHNHEKQENYSVSSRHIALGYHTLKQTCELGYCVFIDEVKHTAFSSPLNI